MDRLYRWYSALVEFLGLLAGILIGLGTLLIAVDVGMRNLWQTGLPWLLDSIEYGMYALTFLAAPWVLRHGAHVRVDIILTSVPKPAARALDLLADLIGLIVSALLLYYSIKVTANSAALHSMILKTVIFPEWWALAVMPLSSLLLIVEFLLRMGRALRAPPTAPAQRQEL